MKTDYIALHKAINYFEDFKVETMRRLMDEDKLIFNLYEDYDIKNNHERYYSLYDGFPTSFPKEISNFLYYFHDIIYIGNEKLEGLSLYGKYKDLCADLQLIPLVKIETKDIKLDCSYSLIRSNEPSRYIIENSYRYNERYREDYNYAVISDALSGEIQYTELCVKYEDLVDLIKRIDEYIKTVEKRRNGYNG